MAGNFIVYLIGYIIAIIGVGFLMAAAGLGQQWILAVVLIMIGLGVVWALSRSQRDAATKTDRDRDVERRADRPAGGDEPPRT